MRHMAVAFVIFGLLPVMELRSETRNFGPFKVDELVIRDFTGLLEVLPVQGVETTFDIEGDPAFLQEFDIVQTDEKLELLAPVPKPINSTLLVTGDISVAPGTELIIGNKHYQAGDPLPEPVKLQVRLPEGQSLVIDGFTGEGRIGDIQGPLRVRLNSGRIEAGMVGDAKIDLEGGGDILLAGIEGNAELAIQGAGLIRIDQGHIGDLICSISGAGTIEVRGEAEDARATISGAGTIDLAHVSNRPDISVTGAGNILVQNHP